ncbi:MAG: Fic family protein [Planctomycetota bacterium]
MELWLPSQLALNGTTNALIQDAEEAARRVDDHRPLPAEVVARIEDELLGERVYNSNAIEGNTLDLRETIMILKQGSAGSAKKREAKEAQNLGTAARAITEWVDGETCAHDIDRLREIHRMILGGIDDDWAGRFRGHDVMIRGAKHQPPDHTLVPALIERVMRELREADSDRNAIFQAAWAHWAIARIHPFHDGNGRIARLWQDIVLLEGKLTCAIIRPEDRREYLESLGQADEGDFNPLVQLVTRRTAATLDKYLTELGRDAELTESIAAIAGEADERQSEKAQLQYQRWERLMQRLRREFELVAGRFSEKSRSVRIQFQRFELIDRAKWQNILSGIGGSRTSYFNLDFWMAGKRRRYCFFFGKHFWTEQDTDEDHSEYRVSLLIGEDDGTGETVRLDKIEGCPIRVREVFVVDKEFVCRKVDSSTGISSYDRGVSATRVALDFIEDVVRHRLS